MAQPMREVTSVPAVGNDLACCTVYIRGHSSVVCCTQCGSLRRMHKVPKVEVGVGDLGTWEGESLDSGPYEIQRAKADTVGDKLTRVTSLT